jgi:DNA-binding XRE family transcriptional regulator
MSAELKQLAAQLKAQHYTVGAYAIEGLRQDLLSKGLIPESIDSSTPTTSPLLPGKQTQGKDLKRLGAVLRSEREEIGIPPATLARKARIGRTTLWMMEKGENPQTGRPSQPERTTLLRVADALRLPEEKQQEILALAGYEENPPLRRKIEK